MLRAAVGWMEISLVHSLNMALLPFRRFMGAKMQVQHAKLHWQSLQNTMIALFQMVYMMFFNFRKRFEDFDIHPVTMVMSGCATFQWVLLVPSLVFEETMM